MSQEQELYDPYHLNRKYAYSVASRMDQCESTEEMFDLLIELKQELNIDRIYCRGHKKTFIIDDIINTISFAENSIDLIENIPIVLNIEEIAIWFID